MPSRTTLDPSWVVLVPSPAVVVTALILLSVSTPRELYGQSWRSVNGLDYGGAGAAVAISLGAVAGGTALAGATAGVLVAGTVVSELSPDASLAAFRQSASILSIAGTVVGIAYLGALWDELTTAGDSGLCLTPAYAPDRGPGLVARIGL